MEEREWLGTRPNYPAEINQTLGSDSNMPGKEKSQKFESLQTEEAGAKIGAKWPFVDYQWDKFRVGTGIENLNPARS